ncbi:caspase activity and apoptosis inhibitor 1 isoform X2 [Cygnus atratus]|uniref:caspase activity and apoptosis inhibitor 1 isoform X2 n=1 Tax=Cygnus atratus TaxID=8868 RepID=UPI0015D5B8E0|nr:caspase activity and apoptosis inhibitor 1 isoform X2 [Cygnus atratus]
MAGRKSSKEKKRRRSRSCCPEGAAGPDGGERKRRSAESARGAPEEEKCNVPSGEKVEEAEQPSDVEEGGLDLREKKLQKMLPDILKNCSMDEIKRLCLEQLELLSEKKLLKILEGKSGADSDTDEDGDGGDKTGGESVSHIAGPCHPWSSLQLLALRHTQTSHLEEWLAMEFHKKAGQTGDQVQGFARQDNSIDSTSSLRDDNKLEGQESKQGKGEDSDVLSINADAYDSDIEGPCNEEDGSDVQENTIRSGTGQIDDLQKDIEKSVNEILGLAESSPKESKTASVAVPPSEGVQPSAQQLELLELEMRARAIKALMKAGDVKKQP